MNVSVAWLRAIAPRITESPADLANRFSLQAAAVDAVETIGEGLEDVVVARVEEASRHPDADRLTLCRVDAGHGGDPLEVVCGAPNVVAGALYPFVPPGGRLPGGFQIEERRIRGIVSHGMLCSEQELGLGRDTQGILRLSDDPPPGTPLVRALGLPDARLVLDLTPNRVDLASHVGVARELAPGGVSDIQLPEFGASWNPGWVDDPTSAEAGGVRVIIEDDHRCPRYLAARVRGVKIGPSPEWLRARLRAAGSRPINNVVDATNYVLLELGQPLHAFDLARVEGSEIRIRPARDDESLVTLDGSSHELDGASTVIADAVRPIGLAGVMGGQDSEVTDETTDLLIECASFDPPATRATAAAAALSTDASYRFERGIDEHQIESALRRCVELILAVAGGVADPQAIRVGRPPSPPAIVKLRTARVRKVLGLRLSPGQIGELLEPLGFESEPEGSQSADPVLAVRVPTWRCDVVREVDLIEEIARRYGYERFPREARSIRPSSVPEAPTWARRRSVRDLLESRGLLEARSLPMVGAGRARANHVPLLLPLSATESVLRTDLVPPLLDRVAHNFSRGNRNVRLYEIGTVFSRDPDGGGPPGRETFLEDVRVGVVLTGGRDPEHWSGQTPDLDLWDLRGLVEDICERLTGAELRSDARDDGAGWLDGDGFAMFVDGQRVGTAGRVRSGAIDAPPWAGPVFAAEFGLDAVRGRDATTYVARPPYPAVTRDVALLVRADVAAADISEAVAAAAPPELVGVRPFDVYDGDAVGGGRSIAWRLVFRAPDRTLTDAEVEGFMDAIVTHVTEELDVRVRDA